MTQKVNFSLFLTSKTHSVALECLRSWQSCIQSTLEISGLTQYTCV